MGHDINYISVGGALDRDPLTQPEPVLDVRLREAAALGFAGAVVPRNNLSADTPLPLDARGVASIDEAIQTLLGFSNPS